MCWTVDFIDNRNVSGYHWTLAQKESCIPGVIWDKCDFYRIRGGNAVLNKHGMSKLFNWKSKCCSDYNGNIM
jgi:hypothetical protein